MWKTKLTKGETTETDYAFKSRQEYCYYVSENPLERKTLIGFLKFCDKRIENGVFTAPKKPSFNTINNHWFTKWRWKESAKQYMKDTASDEKEIATLMYDVNTRNKIIILNERLDELYEDLEYAEDSKEKAKIVDSIDKLEKLIRLLLDKSVNNTSTKNNVEMKHEGLKRLADAFK